MPELPEVETVVRTLIPHVVERSITHVELNRQDIVTPNNLQLPHLIQGRSITEVRRRGKRIIFQLDDTNRFYIHLGMSGRLGLFPPNAPTAKHTHLVLTLSLPPHLAAPLAGRVKPPEIPDLHLRFTDPRRFGGLFWLAKDDPDEGTMGPEPLTLTPTQLQVRLSNSKRPIKSALMDQTVIAGLGNIYVDESLFAAKIHPLRHANKLTKEEVRRLTQSIKQILRRAINHKGSTLRDYRDADGNEGSAQKLHRIYGRDGKPCLTCKTKIERIVLGGRSTCFCPDCQPRHGTKRPRLRPSGSAGYSPRRRLPE